MAKFRFEAADAVGRLHKDFIEADSARSARALLRGRGLTPVSIAAIERHADTEHTNSNGVSRLFASRLSAREQSVITRQLATLLTAGLPIAQALEVLSAQAERGYVRTLISDIRADLLGGMPLASALQQHPRDFPDIYRAIVAAGERSGQLDHVLERLADYVEQRNALKQKIQLAFVYPGVVTVIAFAIVAFLLSYVVPQVVHAFSQAKQALPLLTIMVLSLSGLVRRWGWLLLLGIGALVIGIRRTLKRPGPRHALDRWLLRAPLLGKLVRGYNTVRFASTLAILSTADVPILMALQAAGETLGNRIMRTQVEQAIVRVREGASLSSALADTHEFPPVLTHLIRSGEATGNVATMLERAAQGEAAELERHTLFFAGMLEPILILTMGVVVLGIVLAVMLPIIDLNNLVK